MTEATVPSDASSADVMASVDAAPHQQARLIIADVNCDDAWLSVRAEEAPSLGDWR